MLKEKLAKPLTDTSQKEDIEMAVKYMKIHSTLDMRKIYVKTRVQYP